MTSLLASLALALATAQHTAEPAPEHGAAAHEQAATAAAEHGAKGESETEAYEEETEKREEGLSEVMIGHVADGYVLEYPGYCHGGFSWECETNLRKVFGKSLVFHVGGTTLDMTPTRHLIMMWIASIILLVVVFLAVAKKSLVPRGLYNFVEMLVKFVRDEMAKKNIGEHDGDRFVPYLVSVFFFILFVNLFGLVPWTATATGNVAVTVALAGLTFLITQYAAIKAMGFGGWLKHLTGGVHPLLWPIMIPVEILGLFTKPFALTIRLFANMIAGHFVIMGLLGLIFALGTPFVAVGSIPVALGIFMLELFVAFVQAYIFTMLSSLFIGQGLVHHGGHDDEHAGAAEPAMGHAPDHASHGSHVAGNAPGHG